MLQSGCPDGAVQCTHCELLVKTTAAECRAAAKSLIWVDKHHLPFAECFPYCYFSAHPRTPISFLSILCKGKNDTFAQQFNANEDTLNSLSVSSGILLTVASVMLREKQTHASIL